MGRMTKVIALALLASLVSGMGNNNGQNNTNCQTCGKNNGGNLNDPKTQEALGQLDAQLPFLGNLGLRRNTGSSRNSSSSSNSNRPRIVEIKFYTKEITGLACPVPATFFPTNRSEPVCTTDDDCRFILGEKCCRWFRSSHCLRAIDMTPKAGACPAKLGNPRACRQDFVGCRFDEECSGTQKCCRNSHCQYNECAPAIGQPPTAQPTAAPVLAPAPSPVPVPSPSPVPTRRPQPPTAPSGVRTFAPPPPPTGAPEPPMTQAPPPDPTRTHQNLACPVSPFFFPTTRTEPRCQRHSDCGNGELCCRWGSSLHCLKGIDMTPKPGVCRVMQRTNRSSCKADFGGCQLDAECSGTAKCCQNVNCGYKECMAPATRPPRPPIAPPAQTTPASPPTTQAPPPDPTTTLRNLACPVSPFFFPTTRTEPRCQRHSDCGNGELCCRWGSSLHCLKGIDMTPKPGVCRIMQRTNRSSCKADFGGCQFDAECSGTAKCCQNVNCGYKECMAPAPRPCTRKGCGRAPPRPGCQTIRNSFPNGRECEPKCPYCADPVTPTPAPGVGQSTGQTASGMTCKSSAGTHFTTLEQCTKFSVSTSHPRNIANRSTQSCGPGTLFDVRICGCNHSRLVNVSTCRS